MGRNEEKKNEYAHLVQQTPKECDEYVKASTKGGHVTINFSSGDPDIHLHLLTLAYPPVFEALFDELGIEGERGQGLFIDSVLEEMRAAIKDYLAADKKAAGRNEDA